MEDNRFSLDDVYSAGIDIPQSPANPRYIELEAEWEPMEWDEKDMLQEEKEALASLATQFHYVHLAHLTLLGDIISTETQVRAKRLAAQLVAARIRAMDSWGRYLQSLQQVGTLQPERENYFEHLAGDVNVASALVGITFDDILLRTLNNNCADVEPAFGKLLERDAKQANHNIERTAACLTEMTRTEQEGRRTYNTVRYYLKLIEECIDTHSNDLDTINIDSDAVAQDFRMDALGFYERVSPEEG